MPQKYQNLDEVRDALFSKTGTYYPPKIEGQVSIDKRKLETQEDLAVGDYVVIFRLPNGKFILTKSDENQGIRIRKITPAYILLDGEINLEEV